MLLYNQPDCRLQGLTFVVPLPTVYQPNAGGASVELPIQLTYLGITVIQLRSLQDLGLPGQLHHPGNLGGGISAVKPFAL
jgi:hypothetical protein